MLKTIYFGSIVLYIIAFLVIAKKFEYIQENEKEIYGAIEESTKRKYRKPKKKLLDMVGAMALGLCPVVNLLMAGAMIYAARDPDIMDRMIVDLIDKF